MEWKTDALVLRTADYGEYDRMVTLFTAARGKIGAGMKGVRRANAKLKFAAQPFCFAEYVLAERGGRNTVTGASLHEGFFGLRCDLAALYAATVVLEACDGLLYEGMTSGGLFVSAVGALRGIESGEEGALVKFLLSALSYAGYPVSAENCPVCGKPLSGRMAFDLANGCFVCPSCADAAPASESTYRTIRAALGKGGEFTDDGTRRALRLLGAYYARQTGADLPSLAEYLNIKE